MIQFVSKFKPHNLTAEVIATPEVKAAWEQVQHATIEAQKLDEALELGEARAKTAAHEYTTKLSEAARDGADLTKIKQPEPFDATGNRAQHAAWQTRGREAAWQLGQAIGDAAEGEVARLLNEVEAAEQAVADSLTHVRDAYMKLDSITKRISFNRQAQQYRGHIPIMNLNPDTRGIDSALRTITQSASEWRARDLRTQQTLVDDEIRATNDPARKRELADKIHDLEVARRNALT